MANVDLDPHPVGRRRRIALLVILLGAIGLGTSESARTPDAPQARTSAEWLGLLPAGEAKRKFILDCTGCHQLDGNIARKDGRPRTEAMWRGDVARMLHFSGATTGFPVIAYDRDSTTTAAWLARHLAAEPGRARRSRVREVAGAVTEFELPEPRELPHDVAVTRTGKVVVTGMFTKHMYVLDPATGAIDTVDIPVPQANPRAVEVDSAGHWWVALGAPKALARYSPDTKEWRTFPIGWYPHSLALGRRGEVWANGHFTRDPELIARITPATGARDTFAVPPHPSLATRPGGPIPYELRVGPDGRVWGSELQGNRIFSFDPVHGSFNTYDMPVSNSGPRRFDIGRDGVLWIPAYAANELVRFDPSSRAFRRFELPVPDAVPYVVRIDHEAERIWIGTAAGDAVLSFDPGSGRFTSYPLPSRGALVRHLAIDPRTHEVWVAYGASPGPLGARIARVRPAGA